MEDLWGIYSKHNSSLTTYLKLEGVPREHRREVTGPHATKSRYLYKHRCMSGDLRRYIPRVLYVVAMHGARDINIIPYSYLQNRRRFEISEMCTFICSK